MHVCFIYARTHDTKGQQKERTKQKSAYNQRHRLTVYKPAKREVRNAVLNGQFELTIKRTHYTVYALENSPNKIIKHANHAILVSDIAVSVWYSPIRTNNKTKYIVHTV